MKIALDAGHGFNTAGKRTPDGIREWTLNNRVLLGFQKEIEKYSGVTTVRLDDPTGKTDVRLTTRTNKAKGNGCDVLISFHHNAFQSKWGNHGGTETWIYPNRNSEKLAETLQRSMVRTLGLRDRGIKVGNMHMNREVPFPSALVEVGFMDSNTDRVIRDPNKSQLVGKNMATDFAKLYGLKLKSGAAKPEPTPTPKPTTTFKVGDKVRIKTTAIAYATGEIIPSGYKGHVDTVLEVGIGKTLLKGIYSWVNNSDLEHVGTQNKPTPAPKPKPTPNTSTDIKRGDKVTYSGYLYRDSNGNGRGARVAGTYTATIVNDNKYGIHLDQIGWAEKSKVKKVTGTTSTKIKAGDTVKVINNVQYTGGRFSVYFDKYEVFEVKGDRAVIGVKQNGRRVVTSAVNVSNLRKV